MKPQEISEDDLLRCAEVFSRTFSKAPWNEDWNAGNALERISHFYYSKDFGGVVAKNESVLGFVLGNIEPYYSGSIYYLREMCVEPKHQNTGIGSRLLLHLEEILRLKGVKNIYLNTERDIPAEQFYMKRGYKVDENVASFSKTLCS